VGMWRVNRRLCLGLLGMWVGDGSNDLMIEGFDEAGLISWRNVLPLSYFKKQTTPLWDFEISHLMT